MDSQDILSAIGQGEAFDWEFKSAAENLPVSVWETYAAMANTDGGTIVLGIKEAGGTFTVGGVRNVAHTLKTFWDTVNNRGKVSVNLLSDRDVSVHALDGKTLVVIQVPRAGRRQRPVFLNQNPLTGTYRRNYEGDYRCPDDVVRRMLSDQSEEPADALLLPHFGLDDLHSDSLRQYRNRFASRAPDHPWLSEDNRDFLRKLGGWARRRDTGEEGLTVAGLLMFGGEDALNDPAHGLKYHLDYRERRGDSIADRWHDRLTIDGTWPPNLFQFFQRAFPRLTADLKLPFAYAPPPPPASDPMRVGSSPAHEAVQEAFVNSLIHADYRGQGGVVAERFPDRLELSNPGTLMVSLEQLWQGSVSECRNPSLQRMFQLIGAGDKAGSGIDKVRRGWASQHWRPPTIVPTEQPDRVRVTLPMVSLLPEATLERLQERFGDDFRTLDPLAVQILVTADVDRRVSNRTVQAQCDKHPAAITQAFQGLVRRDMLVPRGEKRGRFYVLPPARGEVGSSGLSGDSSGPNGGSSGPNGDSSTPNVETETPDASSDPALLAVASPAREKRRLSPAVMDDLIVRLSTDRHLTAAELASLLRREIEVLQKKYLRRLVRAGRLRTRYPSEPTHPRQAYTAVTGAPPATAPP